MEHVAEHSRFNVNIGIWHPSANLIRCDRWSRCSWTGEGLVLPNHGQIRLLCRRKVLLDFTNATRLLNSRRARSTASWRCILVSQKHYMDTLRGKKCVLSCRV